MPGPPKKSEAKKKLQGTDRKDRAPSGDVRFEVAEPPKPKDLCDEAAKEWDRVVPELLSSKVLTRMDRAVLTGYVTSWAEWRRLEKTVTELGVYQTTESGYEQIRPSTTARDKARKACHEFARELGLTPPARNRIQIGTEEAAKPEGLLKLVS